MSVMPDHWIKDKAIQEKMIDPFIDYKESSGILSYGLSSYGYDARIDNKFKIFTNINPVTVDPKNFPLGSFIDKEEDICIIPPNSFVLAKTVEYFKIPKDILVMCVGKSTYARCGIVVNVTPLEPGWEGYVTLEFSNTTPLPAKIYAFEGACQFIFLKGDSQCSLSYNEMKGKYMKQLDVTLPIVNNS
ncbi:dCTP deaminase [Ehrlichia canis]|uniref:dCTP deaminase n=1 Tax=Ehrlichia canis (strain Jake) TaxID=269484 RepID=DCD_EHRCJ|nr:dCTP deaminase [Ehrlichia canis]Q3YRB6.1 RecName: Full=dCTP deaminase; AltName: Full=Deoxycytidine triphosphate deaminase [Ehrlichia canis str. Jake]AAZ68739.1 dCTP deaminase [Ehrlichia canis str. Jake]AUO55192.1 dCTP deaminase [Ehrlichia canis]UKC53622.1 dCTP deaminase [Ehrlichia canis]UKC54560.1 dCTP deaminase [Ehrlichia canis]UKC55496.1 dCTP deaminase [Ehrlichia canis]